jgi:DNA-binding MarR family transcriptional regulator
VHLAPRAQRVIEQISSAAFQLRHELLDEISAADLRTCMRVLKQIRQKAEKESGKHATRPRVGKNGQD